jgi:transposase-like protein
MSQPIPLTAKQQYWLDHLLACEHSSQSMKDYAEQYGLSTSAFYAWKKTLRRKGALGGPLLAEPPLFHKAVVPECRVGRARVLLHSGTMLEFDADTDPHWAAALVHALS